MTIVPTHPGLYLLEVPSGLHPIAGASTSNTAFIDIFRQGPVGVATRISSLEDFQRTFGDLDPSIPGTIAVSQFFLNGGTTAWIVRVTTQEAVASNYLITVNNKPLLRLTAASEGAWGDTIQFGVSEGSTNELFTLVLRRVIRVNGAERVISNEVHRDVSMESTHQRWVTKVLKANSTLVRGSVEFTQPQQPVKVPLPDPAIVDLTTAAELSKLSNPLYKPLGGGKDSVTPTEPALSGGLDPLRRIDPFSINILCVPAAAIMDEKSQDLRTPQLDTLASKVSTFCDEERCFYLLDIPPFIQTTADMTAWLGANSAVRDKNATVYFPRTMISDPTDPRTLLDVAPSGTIAGLMSRVDGQLGVWRAPAGTSAQLRGVLDLASGPLNDSDSGALNPIGVNVIRTLPVVGTVSWGARTLLGADIQTSEWKYTSVRRTALYLEQSLIDGLRWVVFSPNDEPLWSQIRLNVTSFMQSLFRRGAFQGKTPAEAYLVRCDAGTTTQADIDRGIVNILVGFAPLKPAEFVVISLQQIVNPPE
ncbi:phage tail sheath C-terminal domain-containing protein [Arthrobacter sp. B0490]|uniref:phage tail sheath family protein n=1 Tax=Arthrobacter sp. B0490 TaxID=2058891 RepID=UPI000CE4D7AB|nr:phage tail sheath C-terminal domain-containing protein [Arthrobacter sp. B0490]